MVKLTAASSPSSGCHFAGGSKVHTYLLTEAFYHEQVTFHAIIQSIALASTDLTGPETFISDT